MKKSASASQVTSTTMALPDKKKVKGHLRGHLSALGAYEMASDEVEYVGKARQCVVFVCRLRAHQRSKREGPFPIPDRLGVPGPLITGPLPRVRVIRQLCPVPKCRLKFSIQTQRSSPLPRQRPGREPLERVILCGSQTTTAMTTYSTRRTTIRPSRSMQTRYSVCSLCSLFSFSPQS